MEKTPETILWYDLETFGLNTRYDRIAQFAAQRTDLDLHPVGSPVVLYGKISDDYLPDPLSCMVTGITPQETEAKGLCEYELIKQVNALFSVPNTTVAGFNNIRFDDEMIRSCLYRNFFDPYEREWKNGCSRWDIIDMVRACHDLRPEGINWPARNPDTGMPIVKLTSLTEANHIDQTGAHDAMVDVYATIEVARLIKEQQPRLYAWAWKYRNKNLLKNLVRTPFGTPVLLTSALFTNPNGYSAMVVPITPAKDVGNTFICFDLMQDPMPLLAAKNPQELMQVPGICTIAVNRCPFVTPISHSFPDEGTYKRLGIDRDKCRETYRLLREHAELIPMLRDAKAAEQYDDVKDTDFEIYSGGFFNDSDKMQFQAIHHTAPSQKLALGIHFQDQRVPEMLMRHVARNWPEVLTEDQARKWKSFCASRILSPPGGVKISWEFYQRKIKENMASTDIAPEVKRDVLEPLEVWGKRLSDKLFGPKADVGPAT